MVFVQIPSKIFFSRHKIWVITSDHGRDAKLPVMSITWPEMCQNCQLHQFGGRGKYINDFKNLLIQTHQSECCQIWVITFGQGPVVQLSFPRDVGCLFLFKFIFSVTAWVRHKIFNMSDSERFFNDNCDVIGHLIWQPCWKRKILDLCLKLLRGIFFNSEHVKNSPLRKIYVIGALIISIIRVEGVIWSV